MTMIAAATRKGSLASDAWKACALPWKLPIKVGGLLQHARLPTNAAERRGEPHRQHEQHQRVLGIHRTTRSTHCLSAAKFAVKGFTEALITDLRINAPHIKCSVVMPGQIGTSIRTNSRKIHSGTQSDVMDARETAQARARIASMGTDVSSMSDEDIQKMVAERERRFREEAPMTAAAAATVILDGVKADRWRILVGEDAQRIDDLVRHSPERAYDVDFFESFAAEVGWRLR